MMHCSTGAGGQGCSLAAMSYNGHIMCPADRPTRRRLRHRRLCTELADPQGAAPHLEVIAVPAGGLARGQGGAREVSRDDWGSSGSALLSLQHAHPHPVGAPGSSTVYSSRHMLHTSSELSRRGTTRLSSGIIDNGQSIADIGVQAPLREVLRCLGEEVDGSHDAGKTSSILQMSVRRVIAVGATGWRGGA